MLSVVYTTAVMSAVAFSASLALTFHSRLSAHRTELAQYRALMHSDVCSDPLIRTRTADVNNCAAADRMLSGGALSPGTLALLETLQRLSLCAGEMDSAGAVQNRCDSVMEAISAASTKILVAAVVLVVALAWTHQQRRAMRTVRTTQLPLDAQDYPSGGLPPWLRE